jgi:hypothetical protein
MMKEYLEMEFPDWLFVNSQKNYATFHSVSKHFFSTYKVLGIMIGSGDISSLKIRVYSLGNQGIHV